MAFSCCQALLVSRFPFAYQTGFDALEVLRLESLAEGASHAAICTGLPQFSGSDSWEDKLRRFFEKEIGLQLVGVSICWDFEEKRQDVKAPPAVYQKKSII